MKTLHPIVLSGGSGSRLWPLSRTSFPKQLLALTSDHSMLQETMLRLNVLDEVAPPSIICNQEHRFLIAEQLREIGMAAKVIMLEPVPRNTAAAAAAAALHIAAQSPDDLMMLMPADHVISNEPAFYEAVTQAVAMARQGYLVTFGIQPHRADTGYGYIQRGAALTTGIGSKETYAVARFVEKPDAAKAGQYLESGDYLWNSGIFVFKVRDLLEELARLCPDVLECCRSAMEQAYDDLDFFRLGEEGFSACPSVSLDNAVMEKTDKAAVVPADFGWSDVGSWSSLWEANAKDEEGNATSGEVYAYNSRNCYIKAEKRLVAAVGVEDLVIVETADAILVSHKDHDQDVKKVVERLQQEGRTEHETHRKVYRPWGSYEGVETGDRFQVKRLVVNPGQQSSMQKHFHRSEHWIVVRGTAEVTINDQAYIVSENESVYIPQAATHRIHNPGRIPLHFIEVQSGSYLGEDDIVRIEDSYGRDSA